MPIYALGALAPIIHPQTWIAPNALVIGEVHLEKNVSIWWNCILRGDIDLLHVGENTNIQDGSVLHTDPGIRVSIGRDVTVGHRAILHGCTIGDACLIGMGATLLNRSVIGKQCLIGANTLIPEGKVIPDRSLVVGAPGRILRQLTDEEADAIVLGTRHYVENWQRYRQELRRLDA
ncbi:MAG: gamma carbonic anhydrase family protein [Candidatus Accumulibacter sp.]|jgi:carbonic anhydrase/acetyltransferase-like protein (isoleucine patch superfamily)|nr:gamma carbonic anhydrase family protein [Accumulibacter sp.]